MKTVKTKFGDKQVKRVSNDANGNPRYVISWLALGLPAYQATSLTRKAGLRKHQTREFGGGFAFQSYHLKDSLEFILETLNAKPELTPRQQKDAKVRQYILDCIDLSGYDIMLPTNASDYDRMLAVWGIFQSEYGEHQLQRHNNNLQETFIAWLQGLPSCFNIDFENYRIIELCKDFGIIPVDATERQENTALKNWWAGIYMAVRKILNSKAA